MAIYKKTTVNQIEITENNAIQVRLGLQIVEDGNIITSRWHRLIFTTSEDIDEQMAGFNDHLNRMGEQPVDQGGVDKIKAIAAVI